MGEQHQEREELLSLVDRIGPKTLAGILITLIAAAATGAVALRDLVLVATVHVAELQKRADDHEGRLRTQEQRPPRLNSGLEDVRKECDQIAAAITDCDKRLSVMERDLHYVQGEQEKDRLCARVQQCNIGGRK